MEANLFVSPIVKLNSYFKQKTEYEKAFSDLKCITGKTQPELQEVKDLIIFARKSSVINYRPDEIVGMLKNTVALGHSLEDSIKMVYDKLKS